MYLTPNSLQNIDLLFTAGGEAGLISSENLVKKVAGVVFDTEGGLLTAAEWRSLIPGLQTICLELSARFCVDVFRDEYFGWDTERFPSRRAHNLVRARGQLSLSRAVAAERKALEQVFLG